MDVLRQQQLRAYRRPFELSRAPRTWPCHFRHCRSSSSSLIEHLYFHHNKSPRPKHGASQSSPVARCGIRLAVAGGDQKAAYHCHQHSDSGSGSSRLNGHGPHSPLAEDGRRWRGRRRRYRVGVSHRPNQNASSTCAEHCRRHQHGHYDGRHGRVLTLRPQRSVSGHASDGTGHASRKGHQVGSERLPPRCVLWPRQVPGDHQASNGGWRLHGRCASFGNVSSAIHIAVQSHGRWEYIFVSHVSITSSNTVQIRFTTFILAYPPATAILSRLSNFVFNQQTLR